jgi:hypothetical protein
MVMSSAAEMEEVFEVYRKGEPLANKSTKRLGSDILINI